MVFAADRCPFVAQTGKELPMTEALHPRPQMRRRDWTDLCGAWQFAHDDDDAGLAAGWARGETELARRITVPYPPESARSGIGDKGFHPVVWYRRSFEAPPLAGGRLLLHFGAVDYAAQVWVNGALVATHVGGHASFTADITDALRPDGAQVVVVRAEDQPGDVSQPRGKQDWQLEPHAIWYHRTTGIWQPVWLEPVPATYIADLHIVPDLGRCGCHVTVELARPAPGAFVAARLGRGDETLARASAEAGSTAVQLFLHVPALENGQARQSLLWTPESPNLLELSVTLGDAEGREIDAVESYAGLRSCAAKENRFLLNDRPYYLRSVLEQGYWPDSHLAAPDADALRREVELIKALGFNAVRIHQKVEDPRFLYWCDRLGLAVWGEMANAYAFSPLAVERLVREWLEVVRRDRNHPSIVTWVPINESWGVADAALRAEQRALVSAMYHLTHALDPTRPVVSNDGWEMTESDIVAVHDYSVSADQLRARWGNPEAVAAALAGNGPQRRRLLLEGHVPHGQPVMITEFGGISHAGRDAGEWHGYASVGSDAEYEAHLRSLFDALLDCPDVAGFCYTQLTDTLQERNGLLREDRAPKLPVETLQAIIGRPSAAVPAEHLDLARKKALAAG